MIIEIKGVKSKLVSGLKYFKEKAASGILVCIKDNSIIFAAIGDNPYNPILQFLQRPQSCFTTAYTHMLSVCGADNKIEHGITLNFT